VLPEQILGDVALLQAVGEAGWRLYAPMHNRVFMQPAVSILFGLRDGHRVAEAGLPSIYHDLRDDSVRARDRLLAGLKSRTRPLLIATIMDIVVQFTFLDSVNLLGALGIGGLLTGVPYIIAREIGRRLPHKRVQPR
jgi:hypothetical protein